MRKLNRILGHITRTRSYATGRRVQGGQLADEYGVMDLTGTEEFIQPTFELESKIVLREVPVRYKTFGKLNSTRDNVLVVCHALTGNSSLDTWWGALLGDGKAFDTSKYFVFCANILGSCYGTCGPTSIIPHSLPPRQYGAGFPYVTVRDCVRLHASVLKEKLKIRSVYSAIGGSLGGMQALEWSFLSDSDGKDPFVKSIIPIACGGRHTPWQIGISELQRQAIYSDPNFNGGNYSPGKPPNAGLALARAIAMVSYRTHSVYEAKFARKEVELSDKRDATYFNGNQHQPKFEVEEYLRYQGEKFLKRFDANSYICITQLMDSHDVARGRGQYTDVLRSIRQPSLVIGIDSDVLYPLQEQDELAKYIPNSTYHVVKSSEGHDGFLLEQDAIGSAITKFLSSLPK